MILDNLTIRNSAGKKRILVEAGRIQAISDEDDDPPKDSQVIRFQNAIAIPGLINSHDHLDFNLFPQLANKKYNNYREWGSDIHLQDKQTIDAVLRIPLSLRVEWGKYKNLLNGFTTVVNHGKKLKCDDELISVFEDCYVLHSPGFEKNWKWKLNNPFRRNKSFVMHIGEGTDDVAKKEIDEVIKANRFIKKIIAIHAIRLDQEQAVSFKGLVWCPASNYFLLGKTIAVKQLKGAIPVVFGTDSALSASWNAWQHFRECMNGTAVNENELMDTLTTAPASLWKLNDRGKLEAGKRADIVIIKNKANLFTADPEDMLLIIHKGEIRLYDESIAPQVKGLTNDIFSRVSIKNKIKFVKGDLPALINKILSVNPAQEFPVDI